MEFILKWILRIFNALWRVRESVTTDGLRPLAAMRKLVPGPGWVGVSYMWER